MTIQHAYQELHRQLQQLYNSREAANISDWVIENITGLRRIDMVIQKTRLLNQLQEEQLRSRLSELLMHRPVQYVLNEAWFAGMKFYVNEDVLIPRPETEELVEWLSGELLSNNQHSVCALDIGTGSGCIAIAAKKKIRSLQVTAIDVSKGALEVAKKNALNLGAEINFLELDFLDSTARSQLPKFDIIVSNPPYVPESDKSSMSAIVVEHEPHTALFVDNMDVLLFYREIASFARNHLEPSGKIYLEIHEDLGESVVLLFKNAGFNNVELKKDMQGKDRMIKVTY